MARNYVALAGLYRRGHRPDGPVVVAAIQAGERNPERLRGLARRWLNRRLRWKQFGDN